MFVIVEKDQIEVGRVAELLAPQLAVRDHGELRLLAMAPRQRSPDGFQGHIEHRVGQFGQPVADDLDRQMPRQIEQQDAKHLGVMGMPQQVHLLLDAVGRREPAAQLATEFGPIERAGQRVVVEQFIEQLRVAVQIRGAPARAAEHHQNPLERCRILR